MAPNTAVMQAVETLHYRVTVGDVASQAGLDIKVAEQGLLALASETGSHIQVAESGEVAYLFPRHFRTILRNKYWRLRFQEAWNKVWNVLFYLIRISFGILLIASIVLIFVTIFVILIALNSRDGDSGGGDSRGHYGGGGFFVPWYWFSPDWYLIFSPNYYGQRSTRRRQSRSRSTTGRSSDLNFMEAIFSFLFGDGNPNANLEEQRWQAIAKVIRNNGGAIAAEQITPYLDHLGHGYQQEYEDYMLPVLSRFNGRPEVSPTGQLVYHFPELQVTATQHQPLPVSAYLRESLWKFSQASSGQIMAAIGLGGVNIVGALMLGNLLSQGAVNLGGLVAFVGGIYWLLLGYGIGFLLVPLIRYFWIQQRNRRIEVRNEQRQERAVSLNQAGEEIQQKIAFAQHFAATTVVDESDLAYTTEKDLTEQELEQADQIDAEWQRRLRQSES